MSKKISKPEKLNKSDIKSLHGIFSLAIGSLIEDRPQLYACLQFEQNLIKKLVPLIPKPTEAPEKQ